MNEAIFALSSGHGKSGVAVVRMSGANLSALAPIHGKELIPRRACLTNLIAADGSLIDRAIVIYFPAPRSFTGEDMIEFHTHGSPPVIEKLFEALRARGARMARPGEFARRAFQNGKMDLVEADGLASLLEAQTDKQRVLALKSMTGGDSEVFESWRLQMISIASHAAAILDYPSDDLPAGIGEKVISAASRLRDEISAAISRCAAARSIRRGFSIALTGETNAGKSSLFNRLVGESRAIVSDIPGTTRDIVSADLDIDGYLVHIWDTAGLRETCDAVEELGIARAREAADNADLVVRVETCGGQKRIGNIKDNEIIVYNKSDLSKKYEPCASESELCVSALTGKGIPELLGLIRRKIHERLNGAESYIAVNARTGAHLQNTISELSDAVSNESNIDIFAEHIRRAADEIGQILGIIGVDEVADAIFGQLCLGK
jgi:tRNA modification GTPase